MLPHLGGAFGSGAQNKHVLVHVLYGLSTYGVKGPNRLALGFPLLANE